jgi:ABC-2 type transport system permease protein
MNLSQLRTMLWLRWRLSRNLWRRGGALNAALMFVFTFLVIALAVLGSIGGVVGGWLALSNLSPQVTMGVFDVLILTFMVFWMVGLLTELQQSQILDLSRFLHLPVALRDVFVLNYVASLFSLSMAAVLPAMLGLALGLALGRGPAMLLLIPAVIAFFFMITAWTYCLRGWLATLMVNKRRRRAIIVGFTFAFILVFQLPNLVVNVWMRPGSSHATSDPAVRAQQFKEKEAQLAAAFDVSHRVIPLLWLPNGARALSEGRVWPALWGALGMFAFGAWGFARAYRGTIRFYQGSETAPALPSPVAKALPHPGKRLLVERKIPFVPEPACAMAMATLRSMSRAPEVKMALVMNVMVFGVIGARAFMGPMRAPPFEFRPFFASGAAAVTFLGLTQLLFNHFGFDRTGFRAIALLPTPRRYILLGKNLALSLLALIVFSVFLVLVTAMTHLRFLDVLAAGFEFVALFLLMSTLGNLASILVPYRVAAGARKATKTTSLTALMIFVSHLTSMLAILPVLLPPLLGMLLAHFYPLSVSAATLPCAAILATLAALLYRLTLEPLGQLMERREPRILEVVTQEIE